MTHADDSPFTLRLGWLAIEPLHWLLLAVPVAAGMRLSGISGVWLFVASSVAIIPLAGLMGRATENLAQTLGAGIGGLLNATFGNAAELIIALMALWKGPQMFPLVKASLTGSIIGNVLLVLGLAILAGGLRYRRLTFNRTSAGLGATLLALACVGLIVPTIYFFLIHGGPGLALGPPLSGAAAAQGNSTINYISDEIAIILALTYVLSLVFTLKTHQHLFTGEDSGSGSVHASHASPLWGRKTALGVLLGATAGVALMSEFLIGSVEQAAHALGMNAVFVGVIVVAVIGNAAEHSTAVLVAMKNQMDLAMNIAVGSSLQIALLIAPLLVLASVLMGHNPSLDLHFSAMEVIAVIIAIAVLALVSQDGESHWMEGVMLLAVYVILALAFFHLPQAPAPSPADAPHASQGALQPTPTPAPTAPLDIH